MTPACTVRVLRCDGQYTVYGTHSDYHNTEETFIENLRLENAVKERCPGSTRHRHDVVPMSHDDMDVVTISSSLKILKPLAKLFLKHFKSIVLSYLFKKYYYLQRN